MQGGRRPSCLPLAASLRSHALHAPQRARAVCARVCAALLTFLPCGATLTCSTLLHVTRVCVEPCRTSPGRGCVAATLHRMGVSRRQAAGQGGEAAFEPCASCVDARDSSGPVALVYRFPDAPWNGGTQTDRRRRFQRGRRRQGIAAKAAAARCECTYTLFTALRCVQRQAAAAPVLGRRAWAGVLRLCRQGQGSCAPRDNRSGALQFENVSKSCTGAGRSPAARGAAAGGRACSKEAAPCAAAAALGRLAAARSAGGGARGDPEVRQAAGSKAAGCSIRFDSNSLGPAAQRSDRGVVAGAAADDAGAHCRAAWRRALQGDRGDQGRPGRVLGKIRGDIRSALDVGATASGKAEAGRRRRPGGRRPLLFRTRGTGRRGPRRRARPRRHRRRHRGCHR